MRDSDVDADGRTGKSAVRSRILKIVLVVAGTLAVIYVAFALLIALPMDRAAQGAPEGVQHVVVTMNEGPWSPTPVAFESVKSVEFEFVNDGDQAHHLIVASVDVAADEMRDRLERGGSAGLIDDLLAAFQSQDPLQNYEYGSTGSGFLEIGTLGLGSELDGDAIPVHAAQSEVGEGGWVAGSRVQPGLTKTRTISNYAGFETLVVLCIDPEHDGRGEHVVVEVTD